MRRAALMIGLACALIAHAGQPVAVYAALYSQSFDANDSANWKVNNNGAGTNAANFFFDYGTVGIPSAPNSAGGTTRGLKLTANTSSATAPLAGVNPGISVSPLGKSFAGNYELKFDWWSNYVGSLGASPATSTQLSTFGILSSGNVANYDGAVDGLMFAATGNGGVADGPNDGDYGAYSPERPDGYRWPIADPTLDHALYIAGSRDNAAAYYTGTFPGAVAAPALQQANFAATQTGVTPAGSTGFSWHQVEIEKIDDAVVWKVDGVLLTYLDTSKFSEPLGGNNIFFGHSDINLTTSASANFPTLEFSLIDNVRVLSLAGDYDQDGDVDGDDFTLWKEHYGDHDFPQADGNQDGVVSALDYTVWRNTETPLGGGSGGEVVDGGADHVPEPAALTLTALTLGLLTAARRFR